MNDQFEIRRDYAYAIKETQREKIKKWISDCDEVINFIDKNFTLFEFTKDHRVNPLAKAFMDDAKRCKRDAEAALSRLEKGN